MNIKRGILGPDDDRVPFPGDTGIASQIKIQTSQLTSEEVNMAISHHINKFISRFDDTVNVIPQVYNLL